MPKLKNPTVAQLHRKLTPIFNLWIRLRDTRIDDDGERVGECISCGQVYPFSQIQAGHFIPANHYVHRYNLTNVNGQCVKCNKWRHGNPFGYWLALRRRHGERMPVFLALTMHNPAVYTVEQLQGMIEFYQQKIKGLEGGLEE